MIKMKNKKAMLPRFTLGLVITIIVILLLFYLASKLFSGLRETQELEMAEKSLEKIILSLETLSKGEEVDVFVFSPTNWIITTWPMGGSHHRPNECKRDGYCLCICSNPNTWSSADKLDYLNGCNEKSKCSDVNKSIEVFNKLLIQIENPPIQLRISLDEDGYEVWEVKDE